MKSLWILLLAIVCIGETTSCQRTAKEPGVTIQPNDKIIFVYGNGVEKAFIEYVMALTQKSNPIICFVPTAAADDRRVFAYWESFCAELKIEPFILETFISSSPEQKTFEEQILGADAIIVGGGNTLNMIAIWKAQGIDTILKRAYEKGIILAGGSAGSLCWFTGGYSDSRPKTLSLIECLGFLPHSHSPHYNREPARKTLYHQAILEGKLKPGYACDDNAGLLFINGEMVRSVSLTPTDHNYFVSVVDGKIVEKKLPAEIIK